VRRALSVRDPASWQSAEAHCPSGLDERFAFARGRLRRRKDAQGDVGAGDRIEEGFRLHPNVDLLDVCHQCPHTTENDVSRPRFLPSFHPEAAFTSSAARAPWALDTTPIGHLRACRELASLYIGIRTTQFTTFWKEAGIFAVIRLIVSLCLGRAVRGARRCDEAIGRVPPHTAENEGFATAFLCNFGSKPKEHPGHTLQATALVNEAYLRLLDACQLLAGRIIIRCPAPPPCTLESGFQVR
jgi:hypothetical protein